MHDKIQVRVQMGSSMMVQVARWYLSVWDISVWCAFYLAVFTIKWVTFCWHILSYGRVKFCKLNGPSTWSDEDVKLQWLDNKSPCTYTKASSWPPWQDRWVVVMHKDQLFMLEPWPWGDEGTCQEETKVSVLGFLFPCVAYSRLQSLVIQNCIYITAEDNFPFE